MKKKKKKIIINKKNILRFIEYAGKFALALYLIIKIFNIVPKTSYLSLYLFQFGVFGGMVGLYRNFMQLNKLEAFATFMFIAICTLISLL